MLYDLALFVAFNRGRARDVEYAAANFLFWSKYQACALVDGVVPGDWDRVKEQLTGFGMCTPGEFHGDIEYFYEVITDETGTRIIAYEVNRTSWDAPVSRANLVRLCEVRAPP